MTVHLTQCMTLEGGLNEQLSRLDWHVGVPVRGFLNCVNRGRENHLKCEQYHFVGWSLD